MAAISVVVPVYKVEQYLKKCIDSIVNQTFQDFELILVEDGSPDKCGEICDAYAETYDYIKVIHKENGGLSDARNVGIEQSKGKYITFIDSDDFIAPHYLENFYYQIERFSADMVVGKYCNVMEGDEVIEKNSFEGVILSKEEVYRRMFLQEDIDVSAWAKMYRRELFQNVRYPVGKIYEDIQIIDKVVEQCNKIVYTSYMGYYYLQRQGSIMYGKMSSQHMLLIETMENLIRIMEANYPKVVEAAIRRYIYCNFHVLGRAVLDKNYYAECKMIRNNILKYKNYIMSNKQISKKERIATMCLNIGMPVYKYMWKLFCMINRKKFE